MRGLWRRHSCQIKPVSPQVRPFQLRLTISAPAQNCSSHSLQLAQTSFNLNLDSDDSQAQNYFMNSHFDAINWINEYFQWNDHLKYDELKPVLGFCLLWNLFEDQQCNRNAKPIAISKCIDHAFINIPSSEFQHEQYKDCLEFFRRRCFSNEELSATDKKTDELLNAFFQNGKDQDLRKIVIQAFARPSPELKIIIYALLLLTWRVRCNLFHGEKELYNLPRQVDLFNAINIFLAAFLGDIKRC